MIKKNGNELNAEWNSADDEWLLPNGWLSARNAANYFVYTECVSVELTSTHIAELMAGERERAVSACLSQKEVFESPEYAGGPLGAVMERFACDQCIEEIRNLGAAA